MPITHAGERVDPEFDGQGRDQRAAVGQEQLTVETMEPHLLE
jgi:hypothetical protein